VNVLKKECKLLTGCNVGDERTAECHNQAELVQHHCRELEQRLRTVRMMVAMAVKGGAVEGGLSC
jgi:hypothetical protein